MSSTTRTPKEAENAADYYPTPQLLCDATVEALLRDRFIDLNFGPALEPSCGSGNWLVALHNAGYSAPIVGVERHPEHGPSPEVMGRTGARLVEGDFLDQTKLSLLGEGEDNASGGFGLIIGNPPFSQASAFIRRALGMLRPDGVLALVMRVGWLTGERERDKVTERRNWIWGRLLGVETSDYSALPKRFYLVMPRPSFGGKGTDSATYVVAVWTRPFDEQEAHLLKPEPPTMVPLVWRERAQNAIERRRGMTVMPPAEGTAPSFPECPDTLKNVGSDEPVPYRPTEPAPPPENEWDEEQVSTSREELMAEVDRSISEAEEGTEAAAS